MKYDLIILGSGSVGSAAGYYATLAVNQPELPWVMLGVVGFITLIALWWQFSPKRSASGMLEPGA